METLIKIWLRIGYVTYWIGWIGSVIIFDVSIELGIAFGAITLILHLLILQILYWINGDGWIWKP